LLLRVWARRRSSDSSLSWDRKDWPSELTESSSGGALNQNWWLNGHARPCWCPKWIVWLLSVVGRVFGKPPMKCEDLWACVWWVLPHLVWRVSEGYWHFFPSSPKKVVLWIRKE
jgi:hypothetical protein